MKRLILLLLLLLLFLRSFVYAEEVLDRAQTPLFNLGAFSSNSHLHLMWQ